MIKGCRILAAARKLDVPKSITTDPELAQKNVEEERFIKSKGHQDCLKRRAQEAPAAIEQISPQEAAAKKAHENAVDEAFEILSATGCKVADETVEALADWKLGKK